MHLVMLTLQETKYKQEKQNIPFSLHGSRRGLGFIRSAKKNDLTCKMQKLKELDVT